MRIKVNLCVKLAGFSKNRFRHCERAKQSSAKTWRGRLSNSKPAQKCRYRRAYLYRFIEEP